MAKISTLSDNFRGSILNTDVWEKNTLGTGNINQNNGLYFKILSNSDFASLKSINNYDWSNSEVVIKIDSLIVNLTLLLGGYGSVVFRNEAAGKRVTLTMSGSGQFTVDSYSIPTSTQTFYIKISHSDNLIKLKGSSDNINWTSQFDEGISTYGNEITSLPLQVVAAGYPNTGTSIVAGINFNASPTTTLNSPANNVQLTTATPTLAFTATDPEGDDVSYQVQVSTSSSFTSTHMDITTATFPSGTQQTRVVSPALTQGAIDYYWRVRSKDPSGSDIYGAWSETRRMISPYLQPIASFSELYTTGVVPHTVFFTDTTTGPATEWLWDFGDGNTSTERNPSHTYEEIGNYTVTLIATNSIGTDTVIKTNLITVTPVIVNGAIRADLKLSGSILTRWRRGIAITSALKLGGSIRTVVSKNVKGVEDKKYLYKVYDEDGTYIETWSDVKDDPRFTQEINSLGSSMTVELARTSDSTQQHVEPLETESDVALQTESGLTIDAAMTARNNIGPGTSIHHNNRVDVWAFYGNDGTGEDLALLLEDGTPILLEDDDYIILDSVEPIERRIFSGFISDINSRYGSTESTVVALSSYGWDLDQYLLTSGTDTTVTYNSHDPSNIAKDAIDKFVVASADPDNLTYIHRTPTSIETTSTVVSYTFKNNTIAEVINKSLELMPSDWYYYVGLGDNVVYFSQRSNTPDHIFTLGKHIISLDLRSYTGNSVNDVVFTGGGDPALYKRYTAPRADRTRRTLSRLADSRVTVEQSAEILSEGTIERNNTMQYRTTLAVASKVYDIERIRVGDMVGFRNFGNYVDDLEFQIVGISYSPDTAQLQLSTLLPDVNQRLEDIRRNMLVEENKNIPNSPS